MNRAVILLGSNKGNPAGNLALALRLIEKEIGKTGLVSHVYETEPWGKRDQQFFLNQAVEVITALDANEVMKRLLLIEKSMGRERMEKWESRIIDLDILYFNDSIIDVPGLIVPHPHLHERRFALTPLCEILPEMNHPILKKKSSELLSLLADTMIVRMLKTAEA